MTSSHSTAAITQQLSATDSAVEVDPDTVTQYDSADTEAKNEITFAIEEKKQTHSSNAALINRVSDILEKIIKNTVNNYVTLSALGIFCSITASNISIKDFLIRIFKYLLPGKEESEREEVLILHSF